MAVTEIQELDTYCSRLLGADQIKDYCPIGLQVENAGPIHRIVSGVTASEALIQAAIEREANAVLVHHGYFWRGEPESLVGMKFRRIKALIDNNIALLAYHLPLDTHAQYGNNAQLGQKLGLMTDGALAAGGTDNLFWYGHLIEPLSAVEFGEHIESVLGRKPVYAGPDQNFGRTSVGYSVRPSEEQPFEERHSEEQPNIKQPNIKQPNIKQPGTNHPGEDSRLIRTVGWCTGGAQQFVTVAAERGLDAYISGEISEQTTHVARECGVHYFAAGHHATERYGVLALGEHLAEQFDVSHQFVDIDNPA